jgi:hypothetical protein
MSGILWWGTLTETYPLIFEIFCSFQLGFSLGFCKLSFTLAGASELNGWKCAEFIICVLFIFNLPIFCDFSFLGMILLAFLQQTKARNLWILDRFFSASCAYMSAFSFSS